MFAAGIPPAVLFVMVAPLLPESPRWLARHGATEAAAGAWNELFRPGRRKALAVAILLSIVSVTVGINAVIFYGPLILMKGGEQNVSAALLGAVMLGSVNLVFSLAALACVDRLGRKPLLLAGLAGMGLAMALLGNCFQAGREDSSSWVLGAILSFVALYAISLGPITWVLVSEVFSTKTRAVGISLCMVLMYLADFAVTLVFPWMMEELGNSTFYLFAGVAALAWLFVWALVPETKGKSLEQTEAIFTGGRQQDPSERSNP